MISHIRSLPCFAVQIPRISTKSKSQPLCALCPVQPKCQLGTTMIKTPIPVSDLRVNYSQTGLDETTLPTTPLPLFTKWMTEAQETKEPEPNAMTLSTVNSDGRPCARIVLLKGFDERGFVWYTNYGSAKSQQLKGTPFAALTFWWAGLERSVRIEGPVRKVSDEESDAYFQSRPPKSRLGAWASEQSCLLESRDVIEKRWENLEKEYLDENDELKKAITRPPHWGGFRLVPDRIEFWKGRSARLHDRIVYQRDLKGIELDGEIVGEGEWSMKRLQP